MPSKTLRDLSPLDRAAELLDRARQSGTEVIHVQHDGGAGSLYDLMTHVCVTFTAQGAFLRGNRATVVADAAMAP